MTSFAILLVLTSAGFHVVTHVALKQSRDRSAFVWWMLIWAGVLFLPIPLLGWTTIPPIGWGLMAFSAIFDSNLTTILTAVILLEYGSGPIKGFAVTLICGLVVSLFTSIVVTKMLMSYWITVRKVAQISM